MISRGPRAAYPLLSSVMDVASVSITDAIGWLSSGILVATIGKQVHKQWHDGQSRGVSRWLFLGQIAASIGFTLYSWLVGNWVFIVTNLLMLGNALVGYAIVLHHRRREARQMNAWRQSD